MKDIQGFSNEKRSLLSGKRDQNLPANQIATCRFHYQDEVRAIICRNIDNQSLKKFINHKLPRKHVSRQLITSIREKIKFQK